MRFLIALLLCASAHAAPPTFPNKMRGALECLDYPDTSYYIRYFQSIFNQVGTLENGAVHFKVTETLYGSPVEEIYVSVADGYGWQRPVFIAAVFSANRNSVQEAIAAYPGLTFMDGAKFGYSFNYTQGGVRMYELDGKAIMMCITE